MTNEATAEEVQRALALMQLGAEMAKVALDELDKMDASRRELLILMDEFVVHMVCGLDISTGKEGRLLADLRANVMRRTAKARLSMDLEKTKPAGNG